MPRIVSISSLKGGVGKTSVTLGLASAALHGGLKTLVIDFDARADTSTGLQAATDTPDITSIMVGHHDSAFLSSVAASGWNANAGTPTIFTSTPYSEGRVHVARGSDRSVQLDSREANGYIERLNRLVEYTEDTYDLILIDCPHSMGTLTSIGWAVSQRVLSIAEPTDPSLSNTEKALRGIVEFQEESGYRVDGVGVVVNKVNPENTEHQSQLNKMRSRFGALVVEPVLHENPALHRARQAAFPIHYWREEESIDSATRFTRLLAGLMATL